MSWYSLVMNRQIFKGLGPHLLTYIGLTLCDMLAQPIKLLFLDIFLYALALIC